MHRSLGICECGSDDLFEPCISSQYLEEGLADREAGRVSGQLGGVFVHECDVALWLEEHYPLVEALEKVEPVSP